MTEYINRASLINNLITFAPEHYTSLLNDLILKEPAANVVEVVRCKDCIHRPSRIPGASDDHEGLNLEFPDDWCPMQCEDGWYNRMPRDDFFCGYGERKEKDNG